MILLALATPLAAAELVRQASRDKRVVARFLLSGEPRAIAVTKDGTLYAGLRNPQSVVAIDWKKGTILREVILDNEEIAATKDFETLRIDATGTRLVIAQGTDESVTILSLPSLAIEREIGLEGEVIRDAILDPKGRYLYILGRSVHVWDSKGDRELRNFTAIDPMAIAASADGRWLAIIGSEKFSNGKATVFSLIDTSKLEESRREPLQTERTIASALFAANDRALVVFADDWVAEKSLAPLAPQVMSGSEGARRVKISAADLISTEQICLPTERGPQVAIPGAASNVVWFAERRCSTSGSTVATPRQVSTESLYGIDAWAIAYDVSSGHLVASDGEETITVYRAPGAAKTP
ncbi:MAG TPA: hypothetical protein VM557_13225 [Thermoanaerobaculia bacterium]|nr:hypothetical protein [Thermoanaerobaculia bacterium]